MDVWKLVFVILLVAALCGAAVWFGTHALTTIADTGAQARTQFAGAVSAWQVISRIFGVSVASAFDVALAIAGAFVTVFFAFRLIRWVNGA